MSVREGWVVLRLGLVLWTGLELGSELSCDDDGDDGDDEGL